MSFFKKNIKYFIGAAILLGVTGFVLGLRKRNKLVKNSLNDDLESKKWSSDTNFFVNADGKNLFELGKKAGITMKRNTGLNGSGYSANKYNQYKDNDKVYWCIYDIQKDKPIAYSKNADTNVYGASVPKICVAAAAFDNNGGKFATDKDYQMAIKLLVKSDNEVWTPVQNLAGGVEAVNSWAEKMGYKMKPARNGGNNCNALDMCKLFSDVCRNRFKGAENIFKMSSACQTHSSRSLKYMPTDVYIGGKTGTYNVSNHDCCFIQKGDKFYAISVLTELGSAGSDVIACMFRGLYDEYID